MASPLPSASPSPTTWLSPLPSPEPFPSPLGLGAQADLPIWPYLLQLGLVTAVVAALGYVTLKLMRDKLPGLGLTFGGGTIKVLDRVSVDQTRMVFIVNVGKRYWLLAASGEHVTPVAELTREDVVVEFADALEKEKHRGEKA